MGFRLEDLDYAAFYNDRNQAKTHFVSLRLKQGSFTMSGGYLDAKSAAQIPRRKKSAEKPFVITFTLKEGEDIQTSGIGLPSVLKETMYEDFLHGNGKLDDAVTLRQLCQQRTFHVLADHDFLMTQVKSDFNAWFGQYTRRRAPFPFTNG